MMYVPGDRSFETDSEVEAVAFSKDGGQLAAACRDGKIRVFNTRTGAADRMVPNASSNLAPGGRYATASREGAIALRSWDAEQPARELKAAAPRVASVTASADGALIAGAGPAGETGSENLMRVWDASGRERFRSPAGVGGMSRMAFSPDGRWLVAGSYDADVRIWDTSNGELKRKIEDLTVSMFDIVFSPDGRQVAMGGVDRIVYLWDTSSWQLKRKLAGQPEMISALAFSPDGQRLVSGGFDEMAFKNPAHVLLWDLASGKILRTVKTTQRTARLAYAPDGKTFAVADRGKRVALWAASE